MKRERNRAFVLILELEGKLELGTFLKLETRLRLGQGKSRLVPRLGRETRREHGPFLGRERWYRLRSILGRETRSGLVHLEEVERR